MIQYVEEEGYKSDNSSRSEYSVQSIIGKKLHRRSIFYKVHWKGYRKSEATWEPMPNLRNCKELIKKFEKKEKRSNRRNTCNKDSKEKTPDRIDYRVDIDNELNLGYEPLRILTGIKNPDQEEDGILLLIEWKENNYGVKPENSYISSKDFKLINPRMLADYYEKHIKWVK